ncbi:transcriptional activator domain protein [Baekduia soli]|uniref:Transcriptional activator domain protein n=1 Tax=Baekduia soli TaxID=496014 RepID=A0A5B8U2Y9_9ACTN|nr:BTAD domain-containing putative transcriptional regulator [Baekduia soli]QEC47282.1 transcriptional activator domain protein [Baekduia soli]
MVEQAAAGDPTTHDGDTRADGGSGVRHGTRQPAAALTRAKPPHARPVGSGSEYARGGCPIGADAEPSLDPRARILQSKITVPTAPERFVRRPRLGRLIAALTARHRIVMVTATAGAGKTTAVVEALQTTTVPVAWLTLESTDSAPGRLLTYLEAAIARERPEVGGAVADALAAGITHVEAAGLLAEALGDAPLTVVVDEVDRITDAPDALAVLAGFARHAAPAARIVLVGRHDLRLDVTDHVAGAVREEDLAFTVEEAGEALAQLGRTDVDPDRAVAVTCGWVTGVLFEAWGAADHVIGTGGEQDPLNGYLALQIMGRLVEPDRDFLIGTAVLDRVTAERAQALGQPAGAERLASLRRAHIPVSWDDGGRAMRCHTRFREYLLECLDRRGDTAAQRRALGLLLTGEGHHEEAVEELLAAEALDDARACAERAIERVMERLDVDVAERWFARLGPHAAAGTGALTTAELMVAVGQEQYARGARIADRLRDLGERERLAAASGRAAATMAWSYFHVGRLDEARAVLRQDTTDPDVAAARYLLGLADAGPSPDPPPRLSGGPLDALVMRVHSVRGHLALLRDTPDSRWAEAVLAPWRISALRATGHTAQAYQLYRSAHDGGSPEGGLHAIVAVEILIDLGRREEALEALRRGREIIARSGSLIFDMQSRIVEAKLHLQLDEDAQAAREILEEVRSRPAFDRYRYVGEMADTWYGLALLRLGENVTARACLERATESMRRADRIMDLPRAAVYLAEAAWRCDDEDRADSAADAALEAADRQGSRHLLLQALTDFPAVASRRIDAEADPSSAWREIGRSLRAQGVAVPAAMETVVELREFGDAAVVIDGDEVHPGLSKSLEVLAYLAAHGGAASRDELLEALFEGRTDPSARAYLRQAAHRLRQALDDRVGPDLVDGRIQLADSVRVSSESVRYEAMLAEAARFSGEERLTCTLQALELAGRGRYLQAVRPSAWTEARREHLDEVTADAAAEAAELAFALGRYDVAGRLADRVLDIDPFREVAWRVRMQIANALGDDDAVMGIYLRCQRSLGEVGAEPSASTRLLRDRLRR